MAATSPRTYAVTGARSGIGFALSEELRAGAHRVISVDLADCDVNADLATQVGRAAMLDGVRALAGDRLDGVAACAGIGNQTPPTISVDYFGAIATLRGLRPLLASSTEPRAVAVASIAALDPIDDEVIAVCVADDEAGALDRANSSYTVYSSSKATLIRWCRAAAVTADWAGTPSHNLISKGFSRLSTKQHGLVQHIVFVHDSPSEGGE